MKGHPQARDEKLDWTNARHNAIFRANNSVPIQ